MTATIEARSSSGVGEQEKPAQFRTQFGRVDRVAVRAMVRRLVRDEPGCRTVAECGLPFRGGAGGSSRLLVEGGRLVGGQLRVCRSALRCAWCSGWMGREFRWRGEWFGARHREVGGWFVHSSLSVPHGRSDSLAVVSGRLWRVWSGLRHLRVLRRWRSFAGVTSLSVLQVVWGAQGWHPHFHVLWFGSGDCDPAEFAGVVDDGWRQRVGSVGLGARRSQALSSPLLEAAPWLEYVTGDDDRFVFDPCLSPSHGGCERCDRGQVGGWVLGDDAFVASGLPVWGGLGVAGVQGDRWAQALVAEFVKSSHGRRRVSSFSELTKRFGRAPERPRLRPLSHGGDRFWVSSGVAGSVELRAHKQRRSLLHEGVSLAAAGDLDGAAGLWSGVSGRRVVVGVSDGAPLFRFENEVVVCDLGGRVMSDVAVLGAEANGTDDVVGLDRKFRLLSSMLAKFEAHGGQLASALADASAEGRGNDVKGPRERITFFHESIVASGDVGLMGRWAELLLAHVEGSEVVDPVAFEWLRAVEGW